MDAFRRRALTYEVAAVLSWILLEGLYWLLSYTGASAPPTLHGVLSVLGVAAIVSYILWNSGDDWTEFGIRLPTLRHLGLGLLLGGVVWAGLWYPHEAVRHSAGASWHAPNFGQSSILGLVFSLLTEAISTVWIVTLFLGLVVTRLRELTTNATTAVVAASLAMAFDGYAHRDAYAGLVRLVAGLVFGTCLVAFGTLWPAYVGYFFLMVLRLSYG